MRLTDEERRIAEHARRRDTFAAAALTGLASDPTIGGSWDDIAVYAVRAADALLARLDATARKDTPGTATAAGGLPTDSLGCKEIPRVGVSEMLNRLHRAASGLYGHRWECDTLPADEQVALWTALRDALGLPPGTATAAGVAAPPADASDEVVGWYVEGGSGDPIRTWEDHCNAARVARACGGTVVPLVRQGAPRGVVVTNEQREAVQTARLIFAQGGESLDHAADRARAASLDALLDAIDAAKGGGE